MLAKRYCNNGKPLLELNQLQYSLKQQIERKVSEETYVFERIPCPICDSKASETLAEKDRYGLYFPVVICRDCGMVYSNPRMTAASYAAFYDCEYRQLYHGKDIPYESLYQEQLTNSGPRVSGLLKEFGFEPFGKRVLEVGCGAGGILAHIRDLYGCDVVGCDYGREALEYGKKKAKLDLRVGSLAEVELPWKADLIIYSHVFEHVMDPKVETQLMRDSLAADGVIYVEIPSIRAIKDRYQNDFLRLLQNAHTFHFTQRSLRNVFSRYGFECLAGNEMAACIFKYTGAANEFVSDYSSILEFLHRAECERKRKKIDDFGRKMNLHARQLLQRLGKRKRERLRKFVGRLFQRETR